MKCPHCDTQIDEHEADKCMDAWVAEAVMGWIEDKENPGLYNKITYDNSGMVQWNKLPPYSTSIADAWQVVEKLEERNAWVSLDKVPTNTNWDFRGIIDELEPSEVRFIAHAPTAQLAICRAALKAVTSA